MIPLVPVVLLYIRFQDANFFGLQNWPRGVVASGPIAAYVFMLYYGFNRIFTGLVRLTTSDLYKVPEEYIGNWHCESLTRKSGKSSSGTLTGFMRAGMLGFRGTLNGEDTNRFADIISDLCVLDFGSHTANILYRIYGTRTDAVRVNYECIYWGHVHVKTKEDPLTITGSWMQISGDERACGTLTLTKMVK
jgi:hypothetical protein